MPTAYNADEESAEARALPTQVTARAETWPFTVHVAAQACVCVARDEVCRDVCKSASMVYVRCYAPNWGSKGKAVAGCAGSLCARAQYACAASRAWQRQCRRRGSAARSAVRVVHEEKFFGAVMRWGVAEYDQPETVQNRSGMLRVRVNQKSPAWQQRWST